MVYAWPLSPRTFYSKMLDQQRRAPVYFLMGPTASGKTDVAAKLTEHLPIELVSVDAAQVYRGMNIGTAKPSAEFLRQYPHHLIDICDPDHAHSAADFVSAAKAKIAEIHGRRRIPLLVGGTMFYFSALEKGMSVLPSADPVVRQQIESEIKLKGIAGLHHELLECDPELAATINPSDAQRVQRAMEIYRISGQPPSKLMGRGDALDYPLFKFTLFDPVRASLHGRIENRFVKMMHDGLVEEVQYLLQLFPNSRDCPSMRTVGYRQVIEMIQGQVDELDMIANASAATRQLAKRQLTWLRQQSGVIWLDATAPTTMEDMLVCINTIETRYC